MAIAAILSYSVMYLFYYRFTFNDTLLPSVEMIKEEYEQTLSEEIRKCRKAQYPNFTLVLIDYVRDEISEIAPLSCDDKSASMLTELYGVDTGSMKKNLELVLIKSKRKHLQKEIKQNIKTGLMKLMIFSKSASVWKV